MNIQKIKTENGVIAVVSGEEKLIMDAQSALDLVRTIKSELGAVRVALPKSAITESFFVLTTGLASDVKQKLADVGGKLAIYGNYTRYMNSDMQDFMYESNNGRDVFFTSTLDDAIQKLRAA